MKYILFLLIFLLAVQTYAQETIEKKPDTAEVVYDLVEKRADFPGGINEFRTQVMKNFNSKKLRMNKGMIRLKSLLSLKEMDRCRTLKQLEKFRHLMEKPLKQ
ncbi:hypothetical protein [Chryseobacterium sp. R2A-55]|uniref:hypothetical protein n=1 Tax=Chryseobacterium sp. R2A-55 TaxID=2744445 RepID=UPI001F246650|nr:hypothetical protein [Chryseobacterium sp. R2A-55]